jgi:ArsR family transcriptional regulator
MFLYEQIDSDKIERTSKRLNLMTHPMRVKIMELLLEGKGCSVTEIYEKMNILQAEASHHLTLLKDFGIVYKVREGKMSIYSIDPKAYYYTLDMVEKLVGDKTFFY